jgi:hypothetical protein
MTYKNKINIGECRQVLNDYLFVDELNYFDQSLKKKKYDLETKILVYSNYEETMSFIIEIQFASLKLSCNYLIFFSKISITKSIDYSKNFR